MARFIVVSVKGEQRYINVDHIVQVKARNGGKFCLIETDSDGVTVHPEGMSFKDVMAAIDR